MLKLVNEKHRSRFGLIDYGWILAAVVITTAALLLFYGRYYSVHQDLAGSALSGKLSLILGGAYRTYMVYFPPAERVWFATAATLSQSTGMRLDLATVAMTSVAVVFSTGLAYSIRRDCVGATRLFLIVPTIVLVVAPILFKNVFGLREHMVVLGLWPYLVLRVSDPENVQIGRKRRALVGLWLGANLLFKYLYAVVVALVETADAIAQRRPLLLFRLENTISGAVVATYLTGWLVIDASQREAIKAMVSAIDANLVDTKTNILEVANQLYFAAFFLIVRRMFDTPARANAFGLMMVIGSIAAALSQGRWYSHHLFPIVMSYIAWWWMVGGRFKLWAHVVVAMYLAVPVWIQHRNTHSYQTAYAELGNAMARSGQTVVGKKVGILTMHPSPYNQYIASHNGTRWNSMANIAYVSAELSYFDKPENIGVPPPPVKLEERGRRMLHEEMLRLWEDAPPDVIILDHSYRWPLRYLDVEWLHIFSKDERFNSIMKNYRLAFAHDGDRIEFKYYVRAD